MAQPIEKTTNQNIWNFVYTVLFVGIVLFLGYLLEQTKGIPQSINIFDFLIIILATLRLTRLFVYDKIGKWIRDMFWDVASDGKTLVKPKKGPRLTIADLLDCPWCVGVWTALFTVFLYYFYSYSWVVLLVLAVAGASSLLQIIANALGWTAERAKQEAQRNQKL